MHGSCEPKSKSGQSNHSRRKGIWLWFQKWWILFCAQVRTGICFKLSIGNIYFLVNFSCSLISGRKRGLCRTLLSQAKRGSKLQGYMFRSGGATKIMWHWRMFCTWSSLHLLPKFGQKENQVKNVLISWSWQVLSPKWF